MYTICRITSIVSCIIMACTRVSRAAHHWIIDVQLSARNGRTIALAQRQVDVAENCLRFGQFYWWMPAKMATSERLTSPMSLFGRVASSGVRSECRSQAFAILQTNGEPAACGDRKIGTASVLPRTVATLVMTPSSRGFGNERSRHSQRHCQTFMYC